MPAPIAVLSAPRGGEGARWGRLASSAVGDGDDLVGSVAARRRDFDVVALALADQRARQGRGDRQPAVLDIGLVLADDPEGLLLVGFFVGQGDGGAEFYDRARQFGDVDDLGAGDLVLELGEAALDKALAIAGGVIFRILGQT